MNNTWKLSILGAFALVASSAVAAVGCTVTSTSDNGDGGTGSDGSTGDGGGGGDTGTADGGGDTGSGNACQAQCAIIDKTQFGITVGFDTDDAGNPVSCGTCDNCSATKCCTEISNCFNAVDGGESDCQSLFKCIVHCGETDGGSSCNAACKAAYDVDGGNPTYDLLTAADNCQQTKCTSECK